MLAMRIDRLPDGGLTRNLGVRVSPGMFDRITEVSRELGVSKNALINAVLERELDQYSGPPVWWDEWWRRAHQDSLPPAGDPML